jgi:hypothetical protein
MKQHMKHKMRLVFTLAVCTIFICTTMASADNDWDFTTNTPHMFSLPAGNIGIGTSSPGAKLDVRGSATFNEDGGNYDFRIESQTLPSIFTVDASRDELQIGVPHFGRSAGVIFTLANNGNTPLEILSCSDTPYYRSICNLFRSRGTISAPKAVKNNDWLGDFQFKGYDGGRYNDAARIIAKADGTPPVANSYTPGKLIFSTSGGYGLLPRMTIRANGYVGIGTSNPYARLDVYGEIRGMEFVDSDNTMYHVDPTFTSRLKRLDIDSNLNVGGNLSVGDDLSVGGDLTVDGDLSVGGNIMYTSPKTYYQNIACSQFTLSDPTGDDDRWRNLGSYGYMQSGVGSYDSHLSCPVHLPEDATVTEFRIYCYDNTDVADLEIGAWLNRRGNWVHTIHTMGWIYGQTASESTLIRSYYNNTISNAVIDNQHYQYYIHLDYNQVTYTGDDMRFYGCRITYTIDTVTP